MQPIILGVQMQELAKIFLCFSADQMKIKADKGLLLLNIIGKDSTIKDNILNNETSHIKNSYSKKTLGININCKLKFRTNNKQFE